MLEKLIDLKEKHPSIGDVRGKGLMVGVEVVADRTTKTKASQERNKIIQESFRKGLLLLGCGESSIRFSPPLVVTEEEVEIACTIFDEVLCGLTRGKR